MKKRHITLLTIVFSATISMAQVINDTINRMVLVESTYNPIIAGAVKRNFIPEEVKPTMNKEQIVYAEENVDLTNFDREAKPAHAVAITPEEGTSGYAHLGYGNYNNLRAMGAYKFRIDERNDWAIKANIDGWSGKLKLDDNTKWPSRLYDMGLETDYTTRLGDVALTVGAHATYYNYNYLTSRDTMLVQSAYNLGAHVGVKGSIGENYYYHANVGYAHFGRSTYFAAKNRHSEGHLHIDASLDRDLYDWGMAKLMVSSDLLAYRGIEGYSNYHSLTITPRWDYRHGDFLFVSGFNLDLLMGKNINTPVQASPDCSISYIPTNRFAAKFTLDGGRDLHTFNSLYTLSPYWASEQQLKPTYTFMNAYLEGSVRIIEGLHLHLGGGYKILSNALFETTMDSIGTTYTGITNHNAQVVGLDIAVSYNYKDIVTLSGKSAYHYWMLKGDQALLTRAPQFNTNIDARVRIIPKLHAYTNLKWITFTGSNERDIIDWSIGANYSLNKQFSFFLDAHNLLNHRHSYYTGYPTQGFNVMAGAMFKF